MTDTPDKTDSYVGARIRAKRRAAGMSQERLAEALGLTFQQIQKYERAANRVSASKLLEIARALDCPVGWFFEGLENGADAGPGLEIMNVADLLPQVSRIQSLKPWQRRIVGRVIDGLADGDSA